MQDTDFFLITPGETERSHGSHFKMNVEQPQIKLQDDTSTSKSIKISQVASKIPCKTGFTTPVPASPHQSPRKINDNNFFVCSPGYLTVISHDDEILCTPRQHDCNLKRTISAEKCLDFGENSFITPRAKIEEKSTLAPPPAPRKKYLSDRAERKRRTVEENKISSKNYKMECNQCLALPSIVSNKENLEATENSTKKSFHLQPRWERICTSPPRVLRKLSLNDMKSNNFYNSMSSLIDTEKGLTEVEVCNNRALFENMRISTKRTKPKLERRVLFTSF